MSNQNLEDIARRLQSILNKIKTSMTSQQRLQIREELYIFMSELPYEPYYEKIRQIAKTASQKLRRDITEIVLEELKSRSEELAAYVSTIAAITNKADADAKVVRMETAKLAVDAATKAIASAKAVKKAIADDDLPTAGDQVEALMETLTDLLADLAKSS
jgi:mannitol-1-phosphate/altronate dehydrogenase